MKKNSHSRTILLLLLISFIVSLFGGCGKTEMRYEGPGYGVGAYQSIDELAALKNDIIFEQQSSYDRDGGNADGFGLVLPDGSNDSGEPTGEESAIRRVLLDVQSPGVVYRMWFTNFGEVPNLRIYVDGDKVVDMDVAELTSGKHYPFVAPFVQDKTQSSGGMVCYLPIVFSKSIKIIGSGNFYYNIDYHLYPADAELEPFKMDMDISKAGKILEEVSADPKYKSDNKYLKDSFSLAPQSKKEIMLSGKRSISSIEMKISDIEAVCSDRTEYEDGGIKMSAGSSVSFVMKAKDAKFLTGRFALLSETQRAKVYVNGNKVSDLSVRKRRADGFEWKDNIYFENFNIELPAASTSGRDEITVQFVAESDIYLYRFWTKNGDLIIDDYDLGDSNADKAHNLTKKGSVASSVQTAEYDPNSLLSDAEKESIFKDEDFLNNIYIKIYFDKKEKPNVEAPISSFFGFGNFGPYKTLTLMTGLKEDGTMYCYYPMPFISDCRIEIENRNLSAADSVEITVGHKPFEGNMDDYGYFSTQYSEYISGTDSMLRPKEYFNILTTEGAGHLVGVTLSMTGDYFGDTSRYYLEGDEVGYIDGKMSHTLHGTGTEDFFNGGWYFNNGTQVNALYGNPVHNYRDGMDRTVMVRSLVADYITFRDGIELVMEHGGANNRTDSNVYVLSYYYHNDRAQMKETDSFSVVDSNEANTHNYVMSSGETLPFTGTLEALYSKRSYSTDFNYVKDYSQFEITIDSSNKGVILRRFMDASLLEQAALVYVDGQEVGIWNERQRAALGFVRWEDYFIPAKYTQGKNKITIKLKNLMNEDGNSVAWSENEYTVFSLC